MKFIWILLPVLLCLTGSVTLFAGEPAGAEKTTQLLTIQREVNWLETEIELQKKQLVSAAKDEVPEITEQINQLQKRLQRARMGFISIASEVEILVAESDEKNKKRDLVQELQQLVEPLFDVIRRVSEKPRRIEELQSRIFSLSEQITQTDKALSNLERVIEAKTYPDFEKQLKTSRETLSRNRDGLQVRLNTLQRKLDQELSDHRTIFQSVTESIQGFFASKGRNLFIAVLVFSGMLWLLLFFKRFIFRAPLVNRRFAEISKPLHMIYGVLAGLASVLAVIVTLHFLNDWFMVTILVLLLIVTGLSSKALITHFIGETKLALNLGSVKQGERVVWQGLPWLVKSLGFRSVLENQALQGGMVMLPASALTAMQSRSTVEGEPWFPTSVGDFVLLDDGSYGHVATQTPESVVLIVGNTRKHYATSVFLSKSPQNFSQGFEVAAEFVIRSLGAASTIDSVRPALSKAIRSILQSRLSGPEPVLRDLIIEFGASGVNSARIWLKADCPGSLAWQRDTLRRELQSVAGEAWRAVVGGGA